MVVIMENVYVIVFFGVIGDLFWCKLLFGFMYLW